jgi:Flp pilus assembly protein TadD
VLSYNSLMRRLALILLLLPAACGGGGNDSSAPVNVPANTAPVDRSAENHRRAIELRDEAKKRIEANDFSGAAELAAQAVKLAPDEPTVHDQLGFAYQKLLRYDDALNSYTRALELFAGKHNQWTIAYASWCAHRLAQDALDKGDTDSALKYVKRAIEIKGGDPALYRLQGSIHYQRKDYIAAAEAYGIAADVSGAADLYLALIWKGQSEFMAEDYRTAHKTFSRIIKDGAADHDAYGRRGHCELRLGWLDDAEIDFRQALARTEDPAKRAEYENALKAIAEAK